MQLEPTAFRLDELEATAHRISINGRVTSAVTKLGLDATVSVLPANETATTNGTGRYGLRNVPVVDSSVVSVTAFGHLPQRAYITDFERCTRSRSSTAATSGWAAVPRWSASTVSTSCAAW
ncbi:hypothetical protein BH23GEM10_BH23GEM10_06080 [soil metagenome]